MQQNVYHTAPHLMIKLRSFCPDFHTRTNRSFTSGWSRPYNHKNNRTHIIDPPLFWKTYPEKKANYMTNVFVIHVPYRKPVEVRFQDKKRL